MKKKIIAFLSVLAISIGAFCTVVSAAKSYAYNTSTGTSFYCVASGPNISVTCDDDLGVVRALNSNDYYYYKYVELTSYVYNSDDADWDEEYFNCNTGNTKSVSTTTTQSTGTTNMLAIGLISYSSGSQTGYHYAGAANARKSISVPYLTDYYYGHLQGYSK